MPQKDLNRPQTESQFQSVEKVLPFGVNRNQPTVEQAKAAMLASGQAPGSAVVKAANEARRAAFRNAQAAGLSVSDQKALAQQASDEVMAGGQPPLLPQAQRAVPVAPAAPQGTTITVRTAADQRAGITQPVPAPTSTARTERGQRIENSQFVAEIGQKNGKWVAEIAYKNGSGTERFVAEKKSDLMIQLLEGKGNATIKVRNTVRQQKLGDEYEHVYKFPIAQATYDAMPAEAKQAYINSLAAMASVQFKEEYTEFYPSAENSDRILDLLNEKKAIISYKNLVRAYEELNSSDKPLEIRPDFEVEVPTEVVDSLDEEDSFPVATASAAVSTAPVAAAPEPQLRKRGITGLPPGFATSGGNTELEITEEGDKSSGPSEAELRALPLSELAKRARALNKPVNRQY